MVLGFGHSVVGAMGSAGMTFTDIEVVIHFVYLLGEAIPVSAAVNLRDCVKLSSEVYWAEYLRAGPAYDR